MKGNLVYIRILEKEDVATTQKWINDPEISDIMGYLPVLSLSNQLDWYEGIKIDKSRLIFAICLVENGFHIGNVALGAIDYVHKHAMFSIFIADKKYRGGGLGEQAARLMIRFAFLRLNLNKVYLRTSERFIAAIKMYDKIGFVREGVMRQHYFIDGHYEDKIIYSILKEEFSRVNLKNE